jgi:hypothetical protein
MTYRPEEPGDTQLTRMLRRLQRLMVNHNDAGEIARLLDESKRSDDSKSRKARHLVGAYQTTVRALIKDARAADAVLEVDPLSPHSLSRQLLLAFFTTSRRMVLRADNRVFPWRGMMEEMELLDRAWDELRTITWLAWPHEGPGFVVLRGSHRSPLVCGVERAVLKRSQYDVVKALNAAGPEGLSGKTLVERSNHSDAVNILKRLRKSDPHWKRVIQLAGVSGRRYAITDPQLIPYNPQQLQQASTFE